MSTLTVAHTYSEVSGQDAIRRLLAVADKPLPRRVHVFSDGGHFPEVLIHRKSITQIQNGVSFLGTPWKGRKKFAPVRFFWTSDESTITAVSGQQVVRFERIRWE